MNEDKFLDALREELPRRFGEQLYLKLTGAQQPDEAHISANGHLAIHPTTGTRRKQSQGKLLTAIAAALSVIAVGVALVINTADESTSFGGEDVISLDNLAPITVDNADQLVHVMTLGNGSVDDVEWSPDGMTVAIAGSTGVHLHDADDLAAPSRLLGEQAIKTTSIEYSPDASVIAGVREDGVWLMNSTTGEVLRRIQIDVPYKEILSFDPAGARIAVKTCAEYYYTTCNQLQVHIWDTATGEELTTYDLDTRYNVVALSDDWSYLAYASGEYGDHVNIIDVETGEETEAIVTMEYDQENFDNHPEITNYPGVIRWMAFSPDGDKLAVDPQSIAGNAFAQIWNMDDLLSSQSDEFVRIHEWRNTINSFVTSQQSLWFRPDDSTPTIFLETTRGISAFDETTGNVIHIFPVKELTAYSAITHVALSPDGSRFLSVLAGGAIQLWDYDANERITTLFDYAGEYDRVAISADHTRLVATGYWRSDDIARQWDLTAETPAETVILGADGRLGNPILYPMLDSQGERLAYSEVTFDGGQHKLYLLDFSTDQYQFMNDQVLSLTPAAFSADGELVYLTSTGNVMRHNLQNGDEERVHLIGFKSLTITALISHAASFTPDSAFIVGWNCYDRNRIYQNAPCQDGETYVWDTHTGNKVIELDTSEAQTLSDFTWTADGQYLAARTCAEELDDTGSCTDFHIIFWDIGSARETAANMDNEDIPVIAPIANLSNFGNPVWNVSLAPNTTDNGLLLTFFASENNRRVLHLWRVDPASGETSELYTMDAPNIYNVNFSPDGAIMALSGNGVIELWGTPQGE
jgi:WD40 repeat protein